MVGLDEIEEGGGINYQTVKSLEHSTAACRLHIHCIDIFILNHLIPISNLYLSSLSLISNHSYYDSYDSYDSYYSYDSYLPEDASPCPP